MGADELIQAVATLPCFKNAVLSQVLFLKGGEGGAGGDAADAVGVDEPYQPWPYSTLLQGSRPKSSAVAAGR